MRSLFILFVFSIICIVVSSCERDSSKRDSQESASDDSPMETTTFFLADIEGMALDASVVSVIETTIQGVSFIEIVAENASTGQVLRLLIPANVPVGSYPMMSVPDSNTVFGTYQPNRAINSNIFVSTSGIFNLSQKSTLPLSISGNTVFAMVNGQGNVDEVTFCEFELIGE